MGSILSGWFGKRTNRGTTDDFLKLDVRQIARETGLQAGCWVTVTWSRRGKVEASCAVSVASERVYIADGGINYEVGLTWTPCALGGRRAWFRCPACDRRCCILYRVRGFACNGCLRLAWPVEREGRHARAERRAWKVTGKAKIDLKRVAGKPRWQRWPTYLRLREQADEAVKIIFERDDALVELIRRVDAPVVRRPRGRPRKIASL